ncbi:MAG: DEAD/DEAH box helicase, partial [Clostridiaceae bacterium]|nr:DEAD/DEAH box helicase [Clostridiaceae bacterium]
PDEYTKDDIKGLSVRRFKKDIKNQVSGSFLERKVEVKRCQASSKEENAFNIFADMQLQMDTVKTQGVGQLFKTSLEKSLFSSPAACIKSIDLRLAKLRKKYAYDEITDIKTLENLREALARINPEDFSRYQNLLSLLRSKEYDWTESTDDRIVIFTERIETMKYLVENLRIDLGLRADAVQDLSGAMSDTEQQEIVENFGREESPIRLLVASDVASEGINLHYLSHRMIHFDIPWSLMVFQQRNGRIDRYGQNRRPDIRYMLIKSENERIKGDVRIIEILIAKEEQALKNIGDPALLLGKFSIEEEELVVSNAIEDGSDTNAFEAIFDSGEKEFNPFEALMAAAAEEAQPAKLRDEDTLYSDINYLYNALNYLNQTESHPVSKMTTVSGLEVSITPDMRRRLNALIPEEAMPSGDYLKLSDDKEFCMAEMKRSMQNTMSDTAWPKTQYLWKLHPIFSWINDKGGLLFGRSEAPIIGLPDKMNPNEIIFIVTGSIPNKKSTPLIDEWFGLGYKNGCFKSTYSMNDVIQSTGVGVTDIPNTDCITIKDVRDATELLPDVVRQAKKHLYHFYHEYQDRMNPLIDEEIDKLASLEEKHKKYQLSISENERKCSEQARKVDDLFDKFYNWVTDTLTIQDSPYIRIIAVMKGV